MKHITLSREFQEDLTRCGQQLLTRIQAASRLLELYAAILLALVAAIAYVAIRLGDSFDAPLWGVALLGLAAVVAERQPVRVAANQEMTVSVLPVLFAAVVYGPLEAIIIGALGLVGDFRAPYARWAIWTALRCASGGLAGLAALIVLTSSEHASFGVLVAAVAAAALAEAVADMLLGSVVVAIRGTGSPYEYVRQMMPLLGATVPLYTPVVALLAYAYTELAAVSVLLFIAPAFAAQSFYRLYRQERAIAEELKAANLRLEKANLSFASALVATLDARDRYTAGHSAAVAVYARDIARRMGLSSEEQKLAHLCGLVHDIGKIGLPPGLLEKPGALTLEERRQMETHSEIGEVILAKVEDYSEIAKIVRHHHERVDGEGYPDRIAGSDIPLISRIIAVADAYNAMTSDRPYRDAMPSRVARLRLAQAVETQFDTHVVAAFEAILAGASDDYRSGVHVAFEREAEDHEELRAIPEVKVA